MHNVYQGRTALAKCLKWFFVMLPLVAATFVSAEDIKSEKRYDFDHKVHYEQTKYNNGHYLLKIKSDSYAHFLQQSVFLLRHSAQLCKAKTPQLTILKGIQRFEKLPTTPRPYQSDLQVELKCIGQ
ncbi:hypothetical protein [Pseudoalteromonas sp. S16_S37]|uniref:hypothetical protein n=1 Tax=Pseudoalteromonas sp. S16_S37 TaxID=2720228 RepID=UPI00167FF002|nr:hypothetical protein [Pseudoalteromonas sp. S16_S37]MBD1582329.1 hypothetical protein [Pseudoalteromonas sp. S16_S37]